MVDITLTRILYMEDDPGLARLLQKSLQRRGYVVETAADGEEGMQKIAVTPYDLLLVDYNMPFAGGIDVIRSLREKGDLTPVLMITGQGNEEVAVEALKLGASDYIVKDAEMKYLELLPVVIDRALYSQQILRERRQMEAAVRESEGKYRLLVDFLPDGMAVHANGRYLFMNPAGARILGAVSPEQMVGRSIFETVHPDYHAVAADRVSSMNANGVAVPWIHERFIRLDGGLVDVEVTAVAFTYEGRPASLVLFRDITERMLTEGRLKRLALYDTLTGLPNRTLFFDRINQLLQLAKRHHYTLGLLYMDLDNFKHINDTLGHEAGDQLLAEASRRMTACTRRADTVARMGGDEFIGICGKIAAPQDAGVVASKIIEALSQPFNLKGHQCSIGTSIGISIYPLDGDDVETLVNKADAAMYRIKEAGKGGYAYFSEVR